MWLDWGDQETDPFVDFCVKYTDEDREPLQSRLPPELMAKVLEEALVEGSQRCVFTRFMPGMRPCSNDTISTIANPENSMPEDIQLGWV